MEPFQASIPTIYQQKHFIEYTTQVRYDNGGAQLGPEATRHQVDHLLWRLEHMGVWQVVWVPAMSYLQDDKGLAIQTEGPSIFTRLPVKHVDALQLTRFYPEDKGDEHQRVCHYFFISFAMIPVHLDDESGGTYHYVNHEIDVGLHGWVSTQGRSYTKGTLSREGFVFQVNFLF